jgi:hypothetical protein
VTACRCDAGGRPFRTLSTDHDDPHFSPDLRAFLSRNYDLKAIADYETGPGAEISPERAILAVQQAKHFVAYFETVLGSPTSDAPS